MRKIFLILMLSSMLVNAQDAGGTGLSFLKFGFGARNIALGDAGNAASNDVTALFYNPARLAWYPESEVLFMHNEWIQDVRTEMLGAKATIFGIPLALGVNITNVSDIEVRTRPGDADSKFNANYFFASLSTGFKILDELSAGVSVKYLYEGMFVDDATGLGFDFGFSYIPPIQNLTVSAVIRNLGSMNQLRNEETELPSDFRIGAAYLYNISDKFDLVTAAEYQKYLSVDVNHLNFGAEIIFNKTAALRAGYQAQYEARGFSGGIGVMWGKLKLDYAFAPFSLGLGSANIFSIQFVF